MKNQQPKEPADTTKTSSGDKPSVPAKDMSKAPQNLDWMG